MKDLEKSSPEQNKKIAMPDGQSDLDEINVRDFDDCSDSDSVNYRRALATQNRDIIVLTNENKQLKEENEKMKKDLAIVDWYLEVFEKGIDSKEIMQNYMEAREKLESLNTAFVDHRKSAEH